MSKYPEGITAEEIALILKDQIAGKNILITGVGLEGIGEEVSRVIALHNPGLLVLTGRSREEVEGAEKNIKAQAPTVNTRILIFDLADFKSIRQAASEANSYTEKFDVLINNAGIMGVPEMKTADGIELHFGVNHVGPFLFTNLLLPKMIENGGGGVITVSSEGYQLGGIRFDDIGFEKEGYNKWKAYGQSKTANNLFAMELAARFGKKGILSYAADPSGATRTKLARYLTPEDFAWIGTVPRDMRTLQQLGATVVYAAFDPDLQDGSNNGAYLNYCAVSDVKDKWPWGRDKEASVKLWPLTEELIGQRFSP